MRGSSYRPWTRGARERRRRVSWEASSGHPFRIFGRRLRFQFSRRDPETPGLRRREAHEAHVDRLVTDPPQEEGVENDVPGARVDDLISEHEDGERSILRPEGPDELERNRWRGRRRRRRRRRQRPHEAGAPGRGGRRRRRRGRRRRDRRGRPQIEKVARSRAFAAPPLRIEVFRRHDGDFVGRDRLFIEGAAPAGRGGGTVVLDAGGGGASRRERAGGDGGRGRRPPAHDADREDDEEDQEIELAAAADRDLHRLPRKGRKGARADAGSSPPKYVTSDIRTCTPPGSSGSRWSPTSRTTIQRRPVSIDWRSCLKRA